MPESTCPPPPTHTVRAANDRPPVARCGSLEITSTRQRKKGHEAALGTQRAFMSLSPHDLTSGSPRNRPKPTSKGRSCPEAVCSRPGSCDGRSHRGDSKRGVGNTADPDCAFEFNMGRVVEASTLVVGFPRSGSIQPQTKGE